MFTFHKFQKSKRASGKSFSIMEKSAGLRKNESTSQSQSNDPMHFLVGKVRNGFGPIGQDDISSIKKGNSCNEREAKRNETWESIAPSTSMCISYQKTMAVIFPVPQYVFWVLFRINGWCWRCKSTHLWPFGLIWTMWYRWHGQIPSSPRLLQEEWRWCYAPRAVLRPHLKWKWCPVILNKNQGSSIGQFVLLEIKFKDLQFRSWLWPRVQIHRHIPCQVGKILRSLCNASCIFVNVLKSWSASASAPQRRWTSVVHYLLQVPCPHLSCQPRLFSVEKKTAASFDWGRSIKPVR